MRVRRLSTPVALALVAGLLAGCAGQRVTDKPELAGVQTAPAPATQPPMTQPETTQTEAAQTETAQTETAQTEAMQTEAAQTETRQTETTQTESTQTEATQTEATQTEATQTEATQTQATPTQAAAQPATESQAAGLQPEVRQPSESRAAPAPEAQAHLDELLSLMQSHSINRFTIDWDAFRARVFARAEGAKSIADTRPAIQLALKLLGDHHSQYHPKSGSVIRVSSCPIPLPNAVPPIPSTVGYVKVGRFQGTLEQATAYTADLQQAIKAADSRGVTGWIIDLRNNTGGNMWPMLTGLSPLLGDGPLGYFIDPTGASMLWELRDGEAYLDGRALWPNNASYRLQSEAPRIAVLTDAATASSGEAVVIAFQGRPDTRSFGTQTCGVSTANQEFPLSNGATLMLTGATMADRSGTPYGGPVLPTEEIADPREAFERALAWLQDGK